ncbi:MAG: hypothetical protein E6R07_10915 [Nevskiaceae bacterium]|nr:MAG: hypothetical protein E6R07_10915 [Nevskiaceae bacterium]
MLTATLLAIEVGRVYGAHRQLQKAAALAALDAARVVSGCSATPTQANLNSAVSTSLSFNGYPSGSLLSSNVEYGQITTDASGIRSLQTTGLNGITDPNVNGARVTLSANFPTLLSPLLPANGVSMRASATASQSALGSLRVGSGVASLSGGMVNQLLSGLLGGNVSLTAVDYSGLSSVNVTASQLATALGLSLNDLSNLATLNQTVALNVALSGLTSALGGTVSTTVSNALQSLAGQANNNPVLLNSILGSVGNVASDVPLVNLGDLIMALALASQADPTGVKSVEIKNVGLDIPNVAAVKVFAKVLQPPKLSPPGRPGQTQASTAQVQLLVRINGNGAVVTSLTSAVTSTLNGLLGTLGALLGLPSPVVTLPNPLNIGLDVTVAPATAYLDRLDCPKSGVNNGQPVAGLSAKTGLATLALGTFSGSGSTAPALSTVTPWTLLDAKLDASHVCVGVNLLGLCLTYANLGNTDIQVNLNPTAAGVSQYGPVALNDVKEFTQITAQTSGTQAVWRANGAPAAPIVPAASMTNPNPQTISSPTSASLTLGVGVTHTGSGALDGAATLVSSLLSAVTAVLQSLLSLVNGLLVSLINPLLSALGLQLGTATVWMDTATVGQPYIVTTALP